MISFLKVVGILLIAVASGELLAAETLASAEGALAAEKYSVALATLERLDKREANEPRARFLKGTALAGIGRLDEAAAVLEKLIAEQPQMPEAMNNLAMVYARQGRNLEAKRLLERAIRVEERYATIHDNLNAVYEGMARNSYAKALRMEGANLTPRLELMHALQAEQEPTAQESRTVAQNERSEPALPEPAAAKGRVEPKPVVVASIEPVVIPKSSAAESRSEEPAPAIATPREIKSAAAAVPPAATKGASLQELLEQRVTAWAAAWSARDAERYLSFYASDFTAGSGSHSEWARERRERLTAPEWIKVALADIKVRPLEKGSAEVTFVQRYEAPHFNGTTLKRLRFTLSNGQWLIVDEASVRGKRR